MEADCGGVVPAKQLALCGHCGGRCGPSPVMQMASKADCLRVLGPGGPVGVPPRGLPDWRRPSVAGCLDCRDWGLPTGSPRDLMHLHCSLHGLVTSGAGVIHLQPHVSDDNKYINTI